MRRTILQLRTNQHRDGVKKVVCSYFKGEESRSIERGEVLIFCFLFSLSYFFHQEKVFSNLRVAFLCNETCGLDTLYRASYFFRTTEESPDILKDQSISRTSNVLFESFFDCVDARSLKGLISCLSFRRHDVFRIFPLKSYES